MTGRRELVAELTSALEAESIELHDVLTGLPDADWQAATPAEGWTVVDQVTHLAFFDDVTKLSITDPDRFQADAQALAAEGDDYPDRVAARFHDLPPGEVLAWFVRSRSELLAAFGTVDPGVRLPWFGPAMSPASSVTARLMETWAHGQDVLDTIGLPRTPSLRMRHVADLGVRARPYAYAVHGLPMADDPIRVELAAPDGSTWTWGPPDARDVVRGPALDFCLLVTQRRHLDDVTLAVTGPIATEWVGIAQAFAGPAGPGRPSSKGKV